jgi:hypothetical protein
VRSSGDGWLKCIYVCPDAMEAITEMEGLAAWFVYKAIKNCLQMMWRIRESVVGRLNVAAGQLIVSPGCGDNSADLLTHQEAIQRRRMCCDAVNIGHNGTRCERMSKG